MSAVTLKAHYDGRHIIPDEPANLPVNTPLTLLITASVAEPALNEDHATWSAFATGALSAAYADHEPEYTIADLKPRP